MRVLSLLYYMPPSLTIAAHRTRRFLDHLPGLGISPVVVTPNLDARAQEGIEVHPFRGPDLLAGWHRLHGVRDSGAGLSGGGRAGKAWKRLLKSWAVPDERWTLRGAWARRAAEAASSGVDAVYSSSSPYTTHLAARDAAMRLGKPWVLEMRDLWWGNPYLPQTRNPVSNAIVKRMESASLEAATRIVVLTDAHARHLSERWPRVAAKVRVVPNAFDPTSAVPVERPRSGPLRVLYAGSLYLGRTLDALAHAAGRFGNEHGFDGALLLAAGRSFDVPWERVLAPAGKAARPLGPVAHEEVLKLMRTSHVGVVHNPASDRLHIPGKVYEYLGAGLPVLDLTTQPDIPRLCEGWVPCRKAPDGDAEAILAALRDLAAWWRGHPEGPPLPGADHPFAARTVTALLAEVFRESAR